MSITQWLMPSLLAVVVLLIARSLFNRDKSRASQINLEDLLLGVDGKTSKAAFVMFGAFCLTTWVIIYQTLAGTLTDVIFAAYLAAWVAPTVTSLLANASANRVDPK